MALYIDFKDGNNIKTSRTFHVDEGYPLKVGIKIPVDDIVEIQADEDELVAIKHQIKGIRMCEHKRVVNWIGDDAKFIYLNLNLNLSLRN